MPAEASRLPYVDGVLGPHQVAATARSILSAQEGSGAIPWVPGQHADIWNHVEAAMGLLAGGEVEAAEHAYLWVPRHQRADGSWPATIVRDRVEDSRGETNMSAYFAVGLWHHWLIRGDRRFVERLWPSVRAGLSWVVDQQVGFGGIQWTPQDEFCLLSGNSSIYQALRAGVALAELVDEPQPEWELAGGRLGHALREHRDLFADKSSYSMDWYYPVLGGAVTGSAGTGLIADRWERFVVPGLGARCVDTNPWVTGAETCELAMSLDNLGDHARALRLLAEMQHLRHAEGGYWTGWVYDDPDYPNDNPDAYWPEEHSTFTAAAVILAADALGEWYGAATPGSGIMRGTSLARPFSELALECGCAWDAEVPAGR
ncbi:prenyltransferase [Nocardioides insulae]|uniref:prenyltransferase n=1 Tax=Nocardioides insulae TaxID=394734 RepID=UPI00041A7BA8|nr:prenyltransferase [Nocardioides insulae]